MKVTITAPRGKMGRLLVKAAMNRDGIDVVAGLGPEGRPYIGQDVGIAAGLGRRTDSPVIDDLDAAVLLCDIIIDFSTVQLSMDVLDAALRHKKALICGTTGFSEHQFARISDAADTIPVLKAANTSYVVHVMSVLLKTAAAALFGKSDIDIIDMHDRIKKDAPSGTAIELAQAMSEAVNRAFKDFVSFHSIRSGDIASSHKVIFGCLGERLEITHHAQDWECFAEGAIDAALFMQHKGPGLYTMVDVVQEELLINGKGGN